MSKIAAVYARVSSDRQREEGTIASQTATVLEYARQRGYTVPQEWVFEDEGYSGNTLVRPGLERLRDLSSEGKVDAIIILGPDRLSRRYAYQVLLLEEFSRCGVEAMFVNSVEGNSPEEKLLIQFQGMIAEYERAQISERSRRGKRHKAQSGCVNVLSGAPYGYRYIKKSSTSDAYYEIVESEAEVVREIFRLYTEDLLSIAAVVRRLNDRGVPTRRGTCRWERSTVWQMLGNPAYKGMAAYGKTESCTRQKMTRPLRVKGGFSPIDGAHRDRPEDEWIYIPVPPLVLEQTFALAQERLKENKRQSSRNTQEPTLLQSMLVCDQCGYALYRTSTRTSKRRIYYYRCIGSDNYRHVNGRVCDRRPIRQDYLDELVWNHLISTLSQEDLVRDELDRRTANAKKNDPLHHRQDSLQNELTRTQNAIDKLLDAYQEDLLDLATLRQRIPNLKKREVALQGELQSIRDQTICESQRLALEGTVADFRSYLLEAGASLTIEQRQKVLRLLVREITVGENLLTINHSIPISQNKMTLPTSYELCTRRPIAVVGERLSECCDGQVGFGVATGGGQRRSHHRSLRG